MSSPLPPVGCVAWMRTGKLVPTLARATITEHVVDGCRMCVRLRFDPTTEYHHVGLPYRELTAAAFESACARVEAP